MPSSFNIFLSSALVYLTYPPVSVSSTVNLIFYLFLGMSLKKTSINLIKYMFRYLSFNKNLVFPSNKTIVFFLGTVLLYVDYPFIQNLEFSAIMFFTLFVATHVSIITSDFTINFTAYFLLNTEHSTTI